MEKIKLVLTDIDGVWTDAGMYYDQFDNEFKKFCTYDSSGVLICKKLNVPVGIITGEKTKIVERRAIKLNVDYLFQGVGDKLAIANELCEKLGITLANVAYIGDDINDYQLLKAVGFSACPDNASLMIKKVVKYVTTLKGGYGAFREFVEYLFSNDYDIEDLYFSKNT